MIEQREVSRFIGITGPKGLVEAGQPDMPKATSPVVLYDGVPHNKFTGKLSILTFTHSSLFAGFYTPVELERRRLTTVPEGTAVWRS